MGVLIFIVLVVYASEPEPYVKSGFVVVKAAILGSILANLLLALGLCFIAGGIRHSEQVFHEVVTEVGSGLLLVAGVALVTHVGLDFIENPSWTGAFHMAETGERGRVVRIRWYFDCHCTPTFQTIRLFFDSTSHFACRSHVPNWKQGHKDELLEEMPLGHQKLTITG